ncbi:hypothetical protein E3O25_13905 [Cryobacterium sp. TMT1-3]|uniref:Uncharacterized protein n=1 Tax=Cryobacterium luteum TaxID=1424661 RepID=A0A1H8JBM1_9MICO|nr:MULTISPECIES: hypothetical protein [Cryobacterium]TFB92348.1 hypothetical protein E3O10_04720 [Cryobacterium luteum]TFC25096.1 hypothetical protein E3O25_13905 [Cryobacterium sp. TMT1-3]SEN78059.1 hypothetical protein SAMN05216281_11423 [Cryobacterium luteum]
MTSTRRLHRNPSFRNPTFLSTWLLWLIGFLAFPIAGLAGTAVGGRVSNPVSALIGGAVCGVVIGVGQVLVSRRRLDPLIWIPLTGIGMGLGLLFGSTVVNYRTTLVELALMGAITGLVLGAAQAVALPHRARRRWLWSIGVAALWALGWTLTTLAGGDVDAQSTNFGAIGAMAFTALSGLLLHVLLPFHPTSGMWLRSSPVTTSL